MIRERPLLTVESTRLLDGIATVGARDWRGHRFILALRPQVGQVAYRAVPSYVHRRPQLGQLSLVTISSARMGLMDLEVTAWSIL